MARSPSTSMIGLSTMWMAKGKADWARSGRKARMASRPSFRPSLLAVPNGVFDEQFGQRVSVVLVVAIAAVPVLQPLDGSSISSRTWIPLCQIIRWHNLPPSLCRVCDLKTSPVHTGYSASGLTTLPDHPTLTLPHQGGGTVARVS